MAQLLTSQILFSLSAPEFKACGRGGEFYSPVGLVIQVDRMLGEFALRGMSENGPVPVLSLSVPTDRAFVESVIDCLERYASCLSETSKLVFDDRSLLSIGRNGQFYSYGLVMDPLNDATALQISGMNKWGEPVPGGVVLPMDATVLRQVASRLSGDVLSNRVSVAE